MHSNDKNFLLDYLREVMELKYDEADLGTGSISTVLSLWASVSSYDCQHI